MLDTSALIENLQKFGVGRRGLGDGLFGGDRAPARLGVYDESDEDLCQDLLPSACPVPGCVFAAASLPEWESHYNARHRYSCGACRRALPSPHLLDLHVQETHDSFFAVLAARKPAYSCYIQECTDKFINPKQRMEHCIKVHKLPKDFRFENNPETTRKSKKKTMPQNSPATMDVDTKTPAFSFHKSKYKGLVKYSGKKFTCDKTNTSSASTNIDQVMSDLKDNLPM